MKVVHKQITDSSLALHSKASIYLRLGNKYWLYSHEII